MLAFVSAHNVRRIVLPRPRPRGIVGKLISPTPHEIAVAGLLRQATRFELTLVTDDDSPARRRRRPPAPEMPLVAWRLAIVAVSVGLVSILGAAEGLEQPGLTEEGRDVLTETVRDKGERLDRYIQNLLDMTRVGHGALKPRTVATDLRELAGAARNRLRGPLRGHPVMVAIPADMASVQVDPVLIEQVLVNILDNARKYAGAGSSIRIAAHIEKGRAILTIEDDGPGLPPGAAAHVFDMFWRAKQGDGGQTGTGLGLAICKGIVEAHGGAIRAEAVHSDGRGTRIVIELPLWNPEVTH